MFVTFGVGGVGRRIWGAAGPGRRIALTALFGYGVLAGMPAHAHAAAAPSIPAPTRDARIRAFPSSVAAPRAIEIVVRASDLPRGTVVTLARSVYPYTRTDLIRRGRLDAAKRIRFSVHPDRDVRYRAYFQTPLPKVPAGAGTVAPLPLGHTAYVPVQVGAPTVTRVTALPLGRVHLTLLVLHPADLRWNGARASWSFSAPGGAVATVTATEPLGPHITVLAVTVALNPGWFGWTVCFHARADHALTDARRPANCSGRGYHGRAFTPYGYPGPGALAGATSYLAGRAGRTGFAVVDSEGRLSGVRIHDTWVTASVVKAMLLVEYLRRLDARGQHYVDSGSDSILYPMIHVSDNSAASAVYNTMGDAGLYALAAAAQMQDFSVNGSWANAQLSPADQAEYFFNMESLIPREFVGYADRLLSTIADYESWGIPAIARSRGYTVFFKGGWRGTSLGQLVHQVGRLSGHHVTFSIAVMTDGDPSMGYGIETIQGVTQALLARPPS